MAEFCAVGYTKSDYLKNANSARRITVFLTARTSPQAARTASRLLRMRASGEPILLERLYKTRAKHVAKVIRKDPFSC